MRRFTSLPLPLLRFAAILFAASTVLYSGLWMYCIRAQQRAVLGIQFEDPHGADSLRVTQVIEGSGAKAAGLQPGDIVRAIDDWTVVAYTPFPETVTRGWPGDVVRLTIERPGESGPRILPVILGPPPAGRGERTPAQAIATQAVGSFPVVFLVVGFFVLFMRLQDRNAWLLALLFASFIAVAPMLNFEGIIPRSLRGFAIAYKVIFNGLFGALSYYFCAVFPVSSPIDRRVPWLKSWLLAAAGAVVVPLGIAVYWAGGRAPLFRFADWIGPTAAAAGPAIYFFGATALALASLVWNGLRAPAAEARRRTRVIVWGTVAGVLPFMALNAAAVFTHRDPYSFPFWVWAPSVLAVLLLPLSFAYAIIKHRVLEIPLILKRGARYLLVQRGFTLLLIVAGFALTVLFARWSSGFLRTRLDLGAAAGTTLGAGFGIALVWTGTRLRTRVTERIDRAFFRSAYDARQIMQALVEKTSAATTREELGAFLAGHIRQALHPSTLAIYLEDGGGSLVAVHGASPAGLGRIPPAGSSMDRVTEAGRRVPLFGRDGRQAGVILLGERLSEEPYSKEEIGRAHV